MRKLLTSSNSVILMVAFVSIVGLLTSIAEAEITPALGIEVETYYVNPHGCHVVAVGDVGECINSFDFFKNQLYYTTGKKIMTEHGLNCDVGFKIYKVLGNSHNMRTVVSYNDVFGFSGGRIKRYGNCMLFNDGGTANYVRMSFDYYIFDPKENPIVVNKLYDSTQPPQFNLWGLSTRRGTDLWAAGTPPFGFDDNKIFYSSIDFDDNDYDSHCGIDNSVGNQTIISIGDVGAGGTGPLAFDSRGNLYYAQGWNGAVFPVPDLYDALIYHFSASEVAAAIDDPVNDRLEIIVPNENDIHVWEKIAISFPEDLTSPIGVSSMVFVEDIGLVLTATALHGSSQLRLYTVNKDGTSGGYTVLASSDGRMSEIRYRLGKIYFNDPSGIYYIDAKQLFDDDD